MVTFIYRDHTPAVLDVTVLLKRWMKAHGNLEPQAVQFQSSFPSIRLHPIPHPRKSQLRGNQENLYAHKSLLVVYHTKMPHPKVR